MPRPSLRFRLRALIRGRAEEVLGRHERPEYLVEAVVDAERRTVRELSEVYVEAQAQRARLEHQLEAALTDDQNCTTAAKRCLADGDELTARALLLRATIARSTAEQTQCLLDDQQQIVTRLEADTHMATAGAQLRAAHATQIATNARHARLADRHARLAFGDDRRLAAAEIFADAEADVASHAARATARRRLGVASTSNAVDIDLHLARARVEQELWQLQHGAANALASGPPTQSRPDKET